MKLNENEILKFKERLHENKSVLHKKCNEVLNNSLHNFHKVILANLSLIDDNLNLNQKAIENSIYTTINNTENFTLRGRKLGLKDFIYNEIFVDVLKDFIEPEFNSKEDIHQRALRKRLEYSCHEDFLKTKQFQRGTEYTFDCFENVTFPNSQLELQRKNWKFQYNLEGWLKYIFELTKINFSEFPYSESKSTNRKTRFLKPLGKEVLFGFEYDTGYLSNEIKKGDICLPHYFNLILTKTSEKTQESLGILGNPLFFEPCFPLSGFSSVELINDPANSNNLEHVHKRNFRENGDGTTTIVYPVEFGEKLKKQAAFYMAMLSYSSESYLQYIEKSIIEAMIL